MTPPPEAPSRPSGPWTPPPAPGRRRGSPVPFVLAGAAALVALVVVLLVFVLGGGDGGEEAFPNRDEGTLLDTVPVRLRSSCERVAEPPDAEGVLASVTCDPESGAREIVFTQFETREELGRAYDGELDGRGLEADAADCATVAEAEHGYVGDEGRDGRLACYRDSGKAFILWTEEEFRVLGTGDSARDKDVDLYRSWAGLVGRTDLVDALLTHVPAEFSDSCEAVPLEDVQFANGQLTTVRCDVASGADTTFYTQYDSAESMDEDYTGIIDSVGVDRDSGPGCGVGPPAENPYSVADAEAGRAACFVDEENAVRLVWTQDELFIGSEAIREDGNYPILLAWWENSGGPV